MTSDNGGLGTSGRSADSGSSPQASKNYGRLIDWREDRGFGFIEPSDRGRKVFVHISDIRRGVRRPAIGDRVYYELATGADGRVRAVNASIAGVDPAPPTPDDWRNILGTVGGAIGLVLIGWIIVADCRGSLVGSPTWYDRKYEQTHTDPPPGRLIKGNVSLETGRRFYHVPGSDDYDYTVIDPTRGERWFATEQEAVAAGWTKAPGSVGR